MKRSIVIKGHGRNEACLYPDGIRNALDRMREEARATGEMISATAMYLKCDGRISPNYKFSEIYAHPNDDIHIYGKGLVQRLIIESL